MKKILALALVMVVLCGCQAPAQEETEAIASVAPQSTPTAEASASASQENLRIIGLSIGEKTIFTERLAECAKQLGLKNGYDVQVVFAAEDKQPTDIAVMLSAGAEALIVLPQELDSLTYIMDECELQGVDVVNIMAPINGEVDAYIAPDYMEIGAKIARLAKSAAKDNGLARAKLFLMECEPDSFTMQLIQDGIRKEAATIETVDLVGAENLSKEDQSSLEDFEPAMLNGANIVFAENATIAAALLEKTANMEHKPYIITIGGEKDTIQKVSDKVYYASVLYGPQKLAELALRQAVNSIKDKPCTQYTAIELGVCSESTVAEYMKQDATHVEIVAKT